MTIRTALLSACAVAGLVLTATPAAATVTVYTANGIFADGTTLGGSFTYDSSAGVAGYTDIGLTLNGALLPDERLSTAVFNSGNRGAKGMNVQIGYSNAFSGTDYISLTFDAKSSSDFAQGILASNTLAGNFRVVGEGGGAQLYALNGGTANAAPLVAAAPEPGTWAMMLAGFGAIGFALRRRRRGRIAFA